MKVGIVGGGISGLSAGILLKNQGHDVEIFEAANKIGGRIHTHRFNEEPDQYFEVGAMRIPISPAHQIVRDLVEYLNDRVSEKRKIETIPYVLSHENNRVNVNGRSFTNKEKKSGCAVSLGFDVPEEFRHCSAQELLMEVLKPFVDLLHKDFDKGFEEIIKYDHMSFRYYLKNVAEFPHSVINYLETICSQTNQYDLSFTELVMQNMDFQTKHWFSIKDGMDRLPRAAASVLGWEKIHLNARITSINDKRPDGKVVIKTSDDSRAKGGVYDKVLLAVPPAALKMIADRPRWDHAKEMAIRGMHFEPLYKMGLRFKTRFWERGPKASFGGQSITDGPTRWHVYPSYGLGTDTSGVLLTYSWANDAAAWSPLTVNERIELALSDLEKMYGPDGVNIREEFLEAQDACWSSLWATGDSMFLPNQFTTLHAVADKPEGNIHFAGEHLSKRHTWISGALESARDACRRIIEDPNLPALGQSRSTPDPSSSTIPEERKTSRRGPQVSNHQPQILAKSRL